MREIGRGLGGFWGSLGSEFLSLLWVFLFIFFGFDFCALLGGFVFCVRFRFCLLFFDLVFSLFALFEAGANADVRWFLVQGF